MGLLRGLTKAPAMGYYFFARTSWAVARIR